MAGAMHALAWAKSVRTGVKGEPLTPSAKLALLCLADYQGRNGWAWPSVETLAADCLVGVRQMHNILRQLEAAGLIEVSRRSTPWGGNRYRVFVGALPAPEPEKEDPAEAAVTASEIRTALMEELLPVLIEDSDTPAEAYLAALDAADTLANDNEGVSRDLRGFLRNAVLAHAAEALHSVPVKQVARLSREAKILGRDGHRWILLGLLQTSSADITGDPCSYVIGTARRLKAERAQGVLA